VSGSLWVDLTDLHAWSGHHTGVQRVVYEIASRLVAHEGARCFAYDPNLRRVAEVKNPALFGEAGSSAATGKPPPATLEHRTRRALRSTIDHMPIGFRRRLPHHSRAAMKRAGNDVLSLLRDTASVFKRARAREEAEPQVTSQIELDQHDTVLVLGKIWDEPALVTWLSAQATISRCRVLYVVYDLIPVFQPHLFGPQLFTRYAEYLFEACTTGAGLMPISQCTRRDLERFCGELLIHPPPTEVIRLGDEVPVTNPRAVSGLQPGRFILTVGTLEVRKNHALLYDVWKLGAAKGVALPKLVIVGRPGWLLNDALYLMHNDPETKDKIVFFHDLSDNELVWLYENCLFTMYPSVYEGWGLPVAESLQHGKVCLSSAAAAMPEVAGDLIDYFNPYDSGECLELVAGYLDRTRLGEAERRIRSGYRPTRWEDTFEQVRRFVNSCPVRTGGPSS
jgi:glycosyltransferase involved in cell wall biosynthesis